MTKKTPSRKDLEEQQEAAAAKIAQIKAANTDAILNGGTPDLAALENAKTQRLAVIAAIDEYDRRKAEVERLAEIDAAAKSEVDLHQERTDRMEALLVDRRASIEGMEAGFRAAMSHFKAFELASTEVSNLVHHVTGGRPRGLNSSQWRHQLSLHISGLLGLAVGHSGLGNIQLSDSRADPHLAWIKNTDPGEEDTREAMKAAAPKTKAEVA